MRKVIIIGSPGAGKSTFARQLRDTTGLPLFYLDSLWHRPDKTNITPEEFDAQLKALVNYDAWIIDGNYQRTLEMRMNACDTVFFMDYPLEVCLSGVKSRIGKQHEDLPWLETEFDAEFRQWIVDFPRDSVPYIYSLIEKYQRDKEIIVFKSRRDADDYLQMIFNQ